MRISDWSSDVCSSDLSLWPAGGYKAGDHCHPFDANRDKQQESDRQPWSAEYLRQNLIFVEPPRMLVEVLIIQRWGRGYSPPFDFHPRLKDCGRAWRHTEGWIGRRMAHKPRRRRRGAIEMSDPMKLVGNAWPPWIISKSTGVKPI